MPLRDHFHPPVSRLCRWTGVHAGWPTFMVLAINRHLPERYRAEPRAQLGNRLEVDIGTFDREPPHRFSAGSGNGNGGLATAVWVPPKPTLAQETDLPTEDDFGVSIYESDECDESGGQRLVASVEIVSPANEDRPASRSAFVEKCSELLRAGVCVSMVDIVTDKHFNLYRDLVEHLNLNLPAEPANPLYAASCRGTSRISRWFVEAWESPLTVGKPLPTLPIWLSDTLAIPLDLEGSYEETCRMIRVK